MVVSRDWQEVSVLECILGGLHIDVAVENEPQRVLARLAKSKVDALIVDCDLNGSAQLLRELQTSNQPNTVPLVIMGGPRCTGSLDESGALFAFEKPISVEQAVRTLSAARSMILDGRLRYHRAGVESSGLAEMQGRESDGCATDQREPEWNADSHGSVYRCRSTTADLMRTSRRARSGLKARAEVVWQDKQGNMGIRFVKVAAAPATNAATVAGAAIPGELEHRRLRNRREPSTAELQIQRNRFQRKRALCFFVRLRRIRPGELIFLPGCILRTS